MTNLLSDEHRRMLFEGSGLTASVVEARGYRTVTQAARLRELGFSAGQVSAPALLIPMYDVHGELRLYQARPDQPRVKGDRIVKYETLAKSKMILDVHPSIQHLLGDPHVPLFITEGVKKGDALVSRGCCAVALLGVWNWRGTNDLDGKTALADWEYVALNGRRVYIVFDSDVMTNPAVHAALSRLGALLKHRGAD